MTAHRRAYDSVWDGGDQRYAVLVRHEPPLIPYSHTISIPDFQVSLGILLILLIQKIVM